MVGRADAAAVAALHPNRPHWHRSSPPSTRYHRSSAPSPRPRPCTPFRPRCAPLWKPHADKNVPRGRRPAPSGQKLCHESNRDHHASPRRQAREARRKGPRTPRWAFSHGIRPQSTGKRGRRQRPRDRRKALQTSPTQKQPHTTENRGVLGSSPDLPRNAKAKQEPAVPGARRFPVVQRASLESSCRPHWAASIAPQCSRESRRHRDVRGRGEAS